MNSFLLSRNTAALYIHKIYLWSKCLNPSLHKSPQTLIFFYFSLFVYSSLQPTYLILLVIVFRKKCLIPKTFSLKSFILVSVVSRIIHVNTSNLNLINACLLIHNRMAGVFIRAKQILWSLGGWWSWFGLMA